MFSGLTKSLGLTKISDAEHDEAMRKQKKGPYSLPSEEHGADAHQSVFYEHRNRSYRISTIADFIRFRDACNDHEGWTERHRTPKVVVYDKPPAKGSIGDSLNHVKVVNIFNNVKPDALYNALHDPDFRKTWDTNMIEGFNICQLDPRNDIGYYLVAFPWPLAAREFINMRCWMEFDNGEFVILNRTVLHNDYPVTQKSVRGVSYLSGYLISPHTAVVEGGEGDEASSSRGCKMTFFTHGDIQGAVPHSLINMAYTKMTPSMMAKLEENAIRYGDWWREIGRDASFVPYWRTARVCWDPVKNAEVTQEVVQKVTSTVLSLLLLTSATSEVADAGDDKQNEELGETKETEQDAQVVGQKIEELKKALLAAAAASAAGTHGEHEEGQSSSDKGSSEATSVAMINDAFDFLNRHYAQNKTKPTNMKEFCEKLKRVVEGVKKATSLK